jgi:hypothetical protein
LRFLVSLCLLCVVGLPTIAQSVQQRKSWEWTLEERIASRTSADAARVRLQQNKPEKRQLVSTAKKSSTVVDSFTGRTHPELFLPHQVFGQLVGLAFLSDVRTGEVFREGMTPDVMRHGLPSDFWEKLRSITTIYAADEYALRGAMSRASANQITQEQLNVRHNALCRSRADALFEARQQFGRRRFDRFLYEVMAVNMFSAAFSLPNPELLRQAEEGCR